MLFSVINRELIMKCSTDCKKFQLLSLSVLNFRLQNFFPLIESVEKHQLYRNGNPCG